MSYSYSVMFPPELHEENGVLKTDSGELVYLNGNVYGQDEYWPYCCLDSQDCTLDRVKFLCTDPTLIRMLIDSLDYSNKCTISKDIAKYVESKIQCVFWWDCQLYLTIDLLRQGEKYTFNNYGLSIVGEVFTN